MWLSLFILGLFISGITAISLDLEMQIASKLFGSGTMMDSYFPDFSQWIDRISAGLTDTYSKYPFIAYGTDWLAFAHVVLAILFFGPLKDPVKNIWVIDFGIICCILVVPFAIIFGQVRDLPYVWTVIDSSFGVFGIIPLLIVRKYIKQLEK
ncbi:hypothetical protein DKT75_06385 [Leucothrix arctica]|uniref:Uncharacterized protein n=1 Tax=Leucothrix arctica TaxID=1481894 RepID=A0A317CGU8_9GAMM|nr:hypothetical protein DKT75_06385 [Leucothrix arctica]